jgi:hypothetical protein
MFARSKVSTVITERQEMFVQSMVSMTVVAGNQAVFTWLEAIFTRGITGSQAVFTQWRRKTSKAAARVVEAVFTR